MHPEDQQKNPIPRSWIWLDIRVSGKTGLQRCLQQSICPSWCSFIWQGNKWQHPHWTTPVHRLLWIRTNVSQQPSIPIGFQETYSPVPGTWEAEPYAGCFFLLRRAVHSDLLTPFMHLWPPLHCLRKGTYRHMLPPSVPSLHIVEMHLFFCLETTITVKWSSGFLTCPSKHSLEESKR